MATLTKEQSKTQDGEQRLTKDVYARVTDRIIADLDGRQCSMSCDRQIRVSGVIRPRGGEQPRTFLNHCRLKAGRLSKRLKAA